MLFREVVELGFDPSYPTFVRELRLLGLRPRCEACRTGGHGLTRTISHEPGEEIQWDWLELHETPWGAPACVLVGALPFSGNEHGSIILTTNRGITQWGEIFEDTTVAVAILDRLLHHATVLQIDGESYRMRDHRARINQLRTGLNDTKS